MNLKKSLFGGYKKDSVDAAIKQLLENEEQAQAKIALLDNEFRLSKENAQKNLESIQTELVIRQKSLLDLNRTLDEKNTRIAELESKQRSLIADFEEQYRAVIAEMEEKHKTKVARLEDGYKERMSSLEERYQQNAALAQQNAALAQHKDDQVKKIGQLYVDAQEYTEKMKMETKAKTQESIDHIFEELSKTQEQFETAFGQISQKKMNLRQLAGEMQDNLNMLQSRVDSMDYEQAAFSASFDTIKAAKDQIKRKIQDEFDKDKWREKEQPTESEKKTIQEPYYEKIPASPAKEQQASPAQPAPDFAAQIEELKNRLERQEELLSLRSRLADTAREPVMKPAVDFVTEPAMEPAMETIAEPIMEPIMEPVMETNAETAKGPTVYNGFAGMTAQGPDENLLDQLDHDGPVFYETPARAAGSDFEIGRETRYRNDKDLSERENYSKYFEEIGKKYSKELPSAPSGAAPSGGTPDTFRDFGSYEPKAYEPKAYEPMAFDQKPVETGLDEAKPDEIKKEESGDADSSIYKKPSIKDILNKYANLK